MANISREEKQLEILKKYYPVDEEAKIITIKLYYENANDLLDYSIGEEKREMFSNELIYKISSLLDQLPSGYKADIVLCITNLNGYSEDILLEKLSDLLVINHIHIERNYKRKCFTAAILVIIGLLILLFNAIAKELNMFGSGITASIFSEAIDITSWVFIWQAVTVLFLSPSDIAKDTSKFLFRTKDISIESDNKILIKKDISYFTGNLLITSKFKTFKDACLLISSTALIFTGVKSIISSIFDLFANVSVESDISSLIVIVIYSFVIVAGIAGILKYLGKDKLFIFAKILAVILLIVFPLIFVFDINDNPLELISDSLSLLVILAFIFSVFSFERRKKN